jgi:cell division cycle 20-like protein 1 (cofactor of APC complex)
MGSPSTPKKKRLLNFSSPGTARMAALTGSGSGALDDMNHEQYSLSPVGRESQRVLLSPRKGVRQISRTPFKVLDAPELAVSFARF